MTLKLSTLSKRYDDKWVLRDISLEVPRGRILGCAGGNGSGKSTLLRLIQGQESASSGQITFEERPLRDAVLMAAAPPKTRWTILSRSAGASDGTRQAATFSAAVESARTVLLLDNPFAGLDRYGRQSAVEKLKNVTRQKNLAVVLASSDDADLFAVCDEIAVLSDSYVSQLGSPREIYEKPGSVAAARALGYCNLLTARRVTFNNQNILEFQTLTGDHRLQVDKTDKAALGAITNNISLAIRPEHISISFGASFPEDNLLKAEIVAIEYQGATTMLKLNANGLILDALVLRLVGLNIGDECMVGLPPDRITVLKQ